METAGEGKTVSGSGPRRPRQRQFGPYGHSKSPAVHYTSSGNTHSGNDGIHRYSDNTGYQKYDRSYPYNNQYLSARLHNTPNFDSAVSYNHQNYNNDEIYSNFNYESSGHLGQQTNLNSNGGDYYSQSLEELYRNHNLDNQNGQQHQYTALSQQLGGWNDRQANWGDMASYFSGLNPQMAPQATRSGSGYLWGHVRPGSGESNEGQESFSRKLGVWDEIVEYFWGNRRSDKTSAEG